MPQRNSEGLQQAEQQTGTVTETAREMSDTLLDALSEVERAVDGTTQALEHAIHRAKEAESVIVLLKYEVKTLKAQLAQRAEGCPPTH